MYTNPLSFIRKARVLSTLLVAIMTNTIVFAEPISHALHNFSSHSEYEKSFSQNNSYTNTATIAKGSKEVNKIEREAKENSLLIGRVATYSAKENFGEIGVDSSINADYVHDNYFTVSIPDLSVYENYIAVLSYDLYGVDAKGATKSINNKVAYGGKHYQKDATWKNVEEYLPIDLLQSGENEIFFNRYKDEAYSYEVKNVQINFQPYLNKSLQESKNDIEKQWEEATINSINYGNTHIESSAYFKTAIAEDESVSKNIVIGLHFKDLKPLPKQLHNVTKGEYLGYRWVTNASEGTIEMQYEDFAIPAGYTEKDVKIYYFDSASRKWSPLPKIAHDYESNTIVAEIIENSSSETDYINGVITNPENPEVAAFAPTQISDMEFANPTDGVVSISPPQANSKGVANTSFPIKLPAGRNGMQPNISIDYSSEGGNGWLGKGWDLTMSNISVNTKWGVPRYDGLYESEVYSLDGQDLVLKVTDSLDNIEYTNAHRKENISRNQGSFHLRKEGAYIEVKRHGK
ncbi:MAG TPA: SpvB/TcaC N-terminal domain-containing protein [Flavobacteriaceae bacterium]|nr:SpvB/TcaC N-terminal domain-containing protein [Flavobacteriaceae bacterium]